MKLKNSIQILLSITLALVIAFPLHASTDHVVTSTDLRNSIQNSAEKRQENLRTIKDFLSQPENAELLKKNSIDADKVSSSAELLSDQELSDLAQRASRAQEDFAAGDLSTRDIMLILLGIVIVLLIVAVAD